MFVSSSEKKNTLPGCRRRSPSPAIAADLLCVAAEVGEAESSSVKWEEEWTLELEDVYALEREGELDKYAPYKSKLKNRMLLWHGSRLTNFVGILSQGLRIAPPEAPATGYMNMGYRNRVWVWTRFPRARVPRRARYPRRLLLLLPLFNLTYVYLVIK
ncbi:Poly ADP-ribose polymerase 1 [Nymphaea thermarum]|nr:Poly ADP-ribose polymerase 1 [Nymphaea thermarum]